jgi:hypothetical protein
MKNWLFSINTILIFSSLLTCNGMRKNSADSKSPTPPDSSVTMMDSISADSIVHIADSLSKDEKYTNHDGAVIEAPKHDAPNQAKIDSIKAAKAKKKKG